MEFNNAKKENRSTHTWYSSNFKINTSLEMNSTYEHGINMEIYGDLDIWNFYRENS